MPWDYESLYSLNMRRTYNSGNVMCVYYYHFNGVETYLRNNCVHECRGYLNKYILFKRINCIWFSFERDVLYTHTSYGRAGVFDV